uniref:Diguanylate cyclase n=1 Tax=candidate division WOR-3 bacterium TaxID=2052148 RepID=A0A7C4X876_UNCW3
MNNHLFLIGNAPEWLKSLIEKGVVSICHDAPDAVLVFEKTEETKEILRRFQSRYIPIITQVKLEGMKGILHLPDSNPDDFLLTILESLTYEREKNPLTGLPGNKAIQREINFRILKPSGFWLGYADLNNFKIFNDRYGFEMGDRLIFHLARILSACVENEFVGHIGGDDFVFIIPNHSRGILDTICHQFDSSLKNFYPEIDWQKNEVYGIDRRGREARFDFVHLSIAVLTRTYKDFSELNYAAAGLKKISKEKSKIERRSLWVADCDIKIWPRDNLIEILKSGDTIAKRTAIEVLGEIGGEENFNLFINLLKEPDFLIRKSAVYALGKLGKKDVVPYLMDALNDRSPHVRMRSVEALGYFYDSQIPNALISALNDPDIYVRSAAIKSIGQLKLKSAIPLLLKIKEGKLVPQVLETLGAIGDNSALNYIEDKLKYHNFRQPAINALGRINTKESLHILLKILGDRSFKYHRRLILRAIYNLSKISDLKQIILNYRDLITEGLQGELPYYEMMILYEIGDKNVNVEMKKFLNDRREFLRRAAVLYLSNGPENLRLLGITLLKDQSPFIRQTAASVLVRFGHPALSYLRRALKDRNFQVRQTAARSIKEIVF